MLPKLSGVLKAPTLLQGLGQGHAMQPALRTPLCCCRAAQWHSAIPYTHGKPGPPPAWAWDTAQCHLPSAGANQASAQALKSASLHKVLLLLLTPSKVLPARRRRQRVRGCNSFPMWKQDFPKDALGAAPHGPVSLALCLQSPLSGTCWKSFWPIEQMVPLEQNWK